MSTFCLIKEKVEAFLKALKSGEINPDKMASMESKARRTYLEQFVGKENAKDVNALFESKLLLKNKQAGYIAWAKKVSGITPQTKRDMIKRIENLQAVLDPKEEQKFLEDLASKRLGVEITEEEAKTLADLSKTAQDLKIKADKNGVFLSKEDRLAYGTAQVNLENFFNGLKLQAKGISFKEYPVKKILQEINELPGVLKSIKASLDNSFFGRQGIKTLYTHPTVWAKSFANSWKDIAKQTFAKGKWYTSGDDAVINAIKADIYSRPNALNGKYKAGGYGLDVLSEEAYPSSLPEKIPLFGRIFKASEVAYNGAALRMRADLADMMIKKMEKIGINTLKPEEAEGWGRVVSSLTGRGNIAMTAEQSQATNKIFFSIKFLKGNFDVLTAHLFDSKTSKEAKKEAARNIGKIVASVATLLTFAKILDKDSVDEDPRSSNFGKIKLFGHWTDITGGMGSLITLASRLTPTYHDGQLGFWMKNSKGDWTDLGLKYGQSTPLDLLESFFEGKLSPTASVLRDIWARKTYSGEPVTLKTELFNLTTPLPINTFNQLMKDPSSSFVLGSMMLDGLGFSVSSTVAPNSLTNYIPEGERITNDSLIKSIAIYAEAIGTDPETAFNRIFTGQKIRRVDNGTVIVERMSVDESQSVKKKNNANNPQMKLDHTIPLELGGSNNEDNLKIVTTTQWKSYTPIENALAKALKDKKISKKEAQTYIVQFKQGVLSKDEVLSKLK